MNLREKHVSAFLFFLTFAICLGKQKEIVIWMHVSKYTIQ